LSCHHSNSGGNLIFWLLFLQCWGWNIVGKHCTTELRPQPLDFSFLFWGKGEEQSYQRCLASCQEMRLGAALPAGCRRKLPATGQKTK
jgi:hypothetical protein